MGERGVRQVRRFLRKGKTLVTFFTFLPFIKRTVTVTLNFVHDGLVLAAASVFTKGLIHCVTVL